MLPTKHAVNPGLVFSRFSLSTIRNSSVSLISFLFYLIRFPKMAQTCSIGFKMPLHRSVLKVLDLVGFLPLLSITASCGS
ncbi:hypothetical protein BCV72DRAFT_329338 [Rhizopus microsporus var. microsporus]|uniref:Uncharacterized protein n=1 Tax=Rhizopus microsporus var. microsporus TaxID=86635 RepID=A0A1X0R2H9_RHIZD|nr:hypothetical protein BCV72DRAFT_329338 [Rhizopus microsporus var. microsporus]